MIRYQQKDATMGMKIGAAAQGFQTGRQVANMAVGAAGRLQAPAYHAGQLAGRARNEVARQATREERDTVARFFHEASDGTDALLREIESGIGVLPRGP